MYRMRDFNDDLYAMQHMRQMESMMDNMMAPFGMFGSMHPGNRRASSSLVPHGNSLMPHGNSLMPHGNGFMPHGSSLMPHGSSLMPHGSSLMPFGFGSNLFPNMDDMFNNFTQVNQDPNCHSFSSSSVMTYTTDETGRPQVYQHSSSTRNAPGGVKETRETLQDSRSGLQKMAIGHHLHEKAHVIEKKKYKYTGEEEENHEYVNLEDDEADNFDQEWQQRAQGFQSRPGPSAVANRAWRDRSPEMLAITDGTQAAGVKKGGMKRKNKRSHKNE